MFAAIVVEILVFAAVCFPFYALITIHSNTAYGTFYNAGQQVCAFVFPFVDVFITDFGEKKHWLNDDYVKFFRFSEQIIDKNKEGVLAFVSNNGYLDNPTFRGIA